MAQHFPICPACLAVESPTVERKGCRVCQVPVNRWAEAWLKAQLALLQRGEMERLEEMRAPVVYASLQEVVERYRVAGPRSRATGIRELARILEQAEGLDLAEAGWGDLTRELGVKWAAMRQEAGRRGWLGQRGQRGLPADGWAQLREAWRRSPWAVDFVAAQPWNTSIRSKLAMANAIFCDHAREFIYLNLRLPEKIGLRKCRMTKLPKPDLRFGLSREVYTRMWEGLDKLKREQREVWALVWLHWNTGVRPFEAKCATGADLQRVRETGQLVLSVRDGKENRLNRGKARRLWPLPADLAEVIGELCDGEGHILGLDGKGDWGRVYKAANAWLRGCGVPGAHTLYHLRKLVATVVAARAGVDAAAESLGNSAAVARDHYIGQPGVLAGFDAAEMEPERVLGGELVPFRS